MPHADETDDDTFQDQYGSQSARKDSLSMNSLDILSVNQLLESVCLFFNLFLEIKKQKDNDN